MEEIWFMEEISPWDMTSNYACLYLTNYKLPTHETLEKKLDKKVSRLRWVVLKDATIELGYAKGMLIIEGKKFNLTYAWGGLNSKENYHVRESYTVQIKGKNCGRYFTNVAKRINKIEGELHCIGNLIKLFPFMNRIKPYLK